MKKIASLVMAFAVMTLVSCGGGGGNTPTKTVKNYFDDIKAGKYEKAMEYYNVDESGMAQLKMLAGKHEEAMNEKGGITSTEIISETISEDGETATVEAKVTYGNGTVEENTFKLVKADGEWKLDLSSK
jgi:hypothetical protein